MQASARTALSWVRADADAGPARHLLTRRVGNSIGATKRSNDSQASTLLSPGQ